MTLYFESRVIRRNVTSRVEPTKLGTSPTILAGIYATQRHPRGVVGRTTVQASSEWIFVALRAGRQQWGSPITWAPFTSALFPVVEEIRRDTLRIWREDHRRLRLAEALLRWPV